MIISIIVAIGKNGELGKDNKLLWSLPEDLKLFKKMTTGHHMIIGRKTYESIGKPLPNRISVVISSKNLSNQENLVYVKSLEEAVQFCKSAGETETFIIGGGTIYKKSLEQNLVDRMYISQVDYSGPADTFFPKFDPTKYTLQKKEKHQTFTLEVWNKIS